ncbi:MAG: hypothetical protein SF051_04775 [Elusimicrobiota bacterium]|nr:hypothetical protein [Elusimicrobiota bacterium]
MRTIKIVRKTSASGKTVLTDFQKQLRDAMIAAAKSSRGIIFYSELGFGFGISGDDEFNFNKLAGEIGTVSTYEHENGRPLLSVVVVRKSDMEPGLGFFKLAQSLGVMTKSLSVELNRLEFYTQELDKVRRYHLAHP